LWFHAPSFTSLSLRFYLVVKFEIWISWWYLSRTVVIQSKIPCSCSIFFMVRSSKHYTIYYAHEHNKNATQKRLYTEKLSTLHKDFVVNYLDCFDLSQFQYCTSLPSETYAAKIFIICVNSTSDYRQKVSAP
jgi:hypothetical protein